MEESDTMTEHINKLKALTEQLEAVGAPTSKDDQVTTLSCSLPDSYNNLTMALQSRTGDLNLDFVMVRLLPEHHKHKENSLLLMTQRKLLSRRKVNNTKTLKKKGKENATIVVYKDIGLEIAGNQRTSKQKKRTKNKPMHHLQPA